MRIPEGKGRYRNGRHALASDAGQGDPRLSTAIRPDKKAILTMDYQATVRYGRKRQRYFSMTLSAENLAAALRQTADAMPEEVVPEADLVELREAPDFDKTFDGSE